MSLLPFANSDGSPRQDAAFVNMILTCALYRQDMGAWNTYAAHAGGTVTLYDDNPNSYPPQIGIISVGRESLVVMGGSTTNFQLVGHVGGTIVPVVDVKVPCTIGVAQVNTSFLAGWQAREATVLAALTTAGLGPTRFAGHSYGGACGHIGAREIVNSNLRPQTTELMTFGQPRTYDGRTAVREPDYYARIIYAAFPEVYQYENLVVDPVCTSPPAIIQLAKVGFVAKTLQKFLGFFWAHHGDPWLLNSYAYAKPVPVPLFGELLPFVNLLQFAGNWQFANLHFPQNYLKRAWDAWKASGLSPDLAILEPYANLYVNAIPLPPANLTPSLTAATINTGYFDPSTPVVTDSTRGDWQVVSAVGFFPGSLTSAPGGSPTVTLMKGTMAFNSIQGGWSESVYSTNPNETLISMANKMDGVMARRCRLSMTKKAPGCNNPIIPVFIRVEDTLVQRDAYTVNETDDRAGFATGMDQNLTNNQNLDLELGARIKYVSGVSRQTAYVVHHGLPVFAYDGVIPGYAGQQYGAAFRRFPKPNASWLGYLANYVGYLAQQGLGFRTITGAWNDQVSGAPGPYSKPDAWYYNPSAQMVELQWKTAGTGTNPPFFPAALQTQAAPNWPLVGSYCRLQVRKWKEFPVLAGRWAARVVPAQTGFVFALQIIRRCRNPNIDTSLTPQVSPIAWAIWYAGSNTSPPILTTGGNVSITGSAIAAQWQFVESKKLGKNFEQQRGRARNRPT